MTYETYDSPGFTIWLNGKKKEGLIRSFLRVLTVERKDFEDGFITLEDNSMWALYAEPTLASTMKTVQSAKTVISFQDFGDRKIAVARVFHEHYHDERQAQLVARRARKNNQNPGSAI